MDDIIALSQKLISYETTAENNSAINEAVLLVKSYLSSFTTIPFVSQGKPSILIHNSGPATKQFKIILNAHIDVVQGKTKQFNARIIDNKLYGRGSYDMKAAAAVFIHIFKELQSKITYPLALQITTDEETGSFGAQKQVDTGYRGEFIITGECGSNLKITNTAKGVYLVKLFAEGITSHGAYPWLGDNAIIKLHAALTRIMIKYPLPKKESSNLTINITKISSPNEATNKTLDYAEASLDIRYTPGDHSIISDITKLLPPGVRLETINHYSPLNTNEHNEYLVQLRKISSKRTNHITPLRAAHATSDIIRFSEAGCACVEFGPIGANQHGDNEWVDIKSLDNYYHILKEFLITVNDMV